MARRSGTGDSIDPDRIETGSPHIVAVNGAMTNAAATQRGIL
jgi:hypothetical protein